MNQLPGLRFASAAGLRPRRFLSASGSGPVRRCPWSYNNSAQPAAVLTPRGVAGTPVLDLEAYRPAPSPPWERRVQRCGLAWRSLVRTGTLNEVTR